jgi:phosphoribosylformylglycinamidine synthase
LIRRAYVEKKADVAAEELRGDLNANVLKSPVVSGLRILSVYDVEGLSEEEFAACGYTVFAEAPVDEVSYDFAPKPGERCFAVSLLPGQFDQRADSCEQCIRAVTGNWSAAAASSRVFAVSGDLSDADFSAVKKYCVNPVEACEIPLGKPEKIRAEAGAAPPVPTLGGFIGKTDAEIKSTREEMGLAMKYEDLLFCRDYFRDEERRDPTETEIRVIDTYWSDHCRHTTFLTELLEIEFEEGRHKKLFEDSYKLYLSERTDLEKPVTLMDLATAAAKALKARGLLPDLDESDEINACSIKIDVETARGGETATEKWLLLFKNETHNHPTEIEPFGGAATCIGGAIRDPLSGRAYVYQAMRVSGAGDPRTPLSETLPGKLPQRKITRTAAAGFSSYGNQIGLATGYVREIYHEGYTAKRMELGAVIGAVELSGVRREAPAPGDLVILVGGATGRDGCGGATGSSKEHTGKSLDLCGAEVQKGNAPTERKLQRLFANREAALLIKRCNDFGAGGVSVAIGELAEGLRIDLSAAPKKYEGLSGTELAISESQERMAVVVDKEDAGKFIAAAREENLDATVVAEATASPRLVMEYEGRVIVNISRAFLNTNGARQTARARLRPPAGERKSLINAGLSDLAVCSQKGLVEMFDSTIGAGSALMPFGGKTYTTPVQAMAAKIPVREGEALTVSLMAHGFDPYLSEWSPFHGGVFAVVDSMAKIAAAGGDISRVYLTFQEYFERMGEDNWGKPLAALLGAYLAQRSLGAAAIGGKDSMSGTFENLSVPPTLVSFAVAAENIGNIITPEFKGAGHAVVLLKTPLLGDDTPDFEAFKRSCARLYSLIKEKIVISAYAVSAGGVFAALAQMSFGNRVGLRGEAAEAFYGSFVLELTDGAGLSAFAGLDARLIGHTIEEPFITLLGGGGVSAIDELLEQWEAPLERVFPSKAPGGDERERPETPEIREWPAVCAKNKFAAPRVLIPVFPGTNCEADTKRAFEAAGASVEVFVVKNLSAQDFRESAEKCAALLRNSQIMAIPGGFSAGDEPNGSGKFIAAFFRGQTAREAVTELLEERDGLILGVCNGFQALLKLGLLPHGRIAEVSAEDPTLTYNTIGRHVSRFVGTRVVSRKSPWLSLAEEGDEYLVPVSHGEGRFVCGENIYRALYENGQIATIYSGFNPNGSARAVEGITSPDGRVFGKMGHSERVGAGLYKNVYGARIGEPVFESGVRYFR